ncbi:type III secretion protein [Burkholderia alba]|uniref:type III secretion protein n=1 Tax=Burkholderia alba TaxID=2683677 RepID=UPI002B0592DF|nr:type III secretion protein [Burkholderia alba]
MYEALERVAGDFGSLEKTLAAPDAASRIKSIRDALGETAERVSAATAQAASDYDRDAMQKIYRGLLAAQRIVLTLHEERVAAA